MLAVQNVEVVYDDVMLVLRGVSLTVPGGAIVALLGANGAGKSTLLRAVSGLLDLHEGEVTRGETSLDGAPIHGLGPSAVASRGIKQVMEGRRILTELTVEDNLRVGGHVAPRTLKDNLARTYELFPRLADRLVDRRRQMAGFLSGGEQQMLAIGRALMSNPRLLLLDEPRARARPDDHRPDPGTSSSRSTGQARRCCSSSRTPRWLSVAHHGYVMENGKIVMDRPAADLLGDDDIREFHLGLGAEGAARSFRDVKHCKRRKRWL